MTRIRKDLQVLGFEVEEPNCENILEANDYYKNCLPQEEDWRRKITAHITKETLKRDTDHKLICDRCGGEIE